MKNIEGIIKGLLYSDNPATPKNIKFPVLREILLSDKIDELLNIRTGDMKNLIQHYYKEIESDNALEHPSFYLDRIKSIQKERLNKVMSGNANIVIYDRLKKMYEDEEIEEIKKDRGLRRFSLYNGFIDIKVTTKTELDYEIQMMKLDAIYNVIINCKSIPATELINWYNQLVKYAKENYGNKPVVGKSHIFVGENDLKKEEFLLYHCLNDDKIYCINRIKLKF